MREMISISMENTKMGPTPSFSLPPGATCRKGVPCFRWGCYAKCMYLRRHTIRSAWDRNYRIVKKDVEEFTRQMSGWLAMYQPKAFRIHVSGDFFSREYILAWCRVARDNPRVKFFAFTKQWDIVRSASASIPDNLSVILSAWHRKCSDGFHPLSPPADLMANHPVAWVVKKDTVGLDEVLKGRRATVCGGGCAECGKCFNRKKGDVLFQYH